MPTGITIKSNPRTRSRHWIPPSHASLQRFSFQEPCLKQSPFPRLQIQIPGPCIPSLHQQQSQAAQTGISSDERNYWFPVVSAPSPGHPTAAALPVPGQGSWHQCRLGRERGNLSLLATAATKDQLKLITKLHPGANISLTLR